MVVDAALRYSVFLGRDASQRAPWQQFLAKLAEYPTTTVPNTNTTIFAEARAINASQSIPWNDNARYPIVYFAAMHPASLLGLSSDPAMLAIARNTVLSINAVSQYRPTNGFCLSWPAATRVTDSTGAADLMDNFEQAIVATSYPNFYPNLGGGGIEQAGGTLAVNELMLQSHEGFVRFFGAWPPGEIGSFSGLRARGGLVASGSIAGNGTVSNLQLVSTVATTAKILNPFTAGAPAARCGGASTATPLQPCGTAAGGDGRNGGSLYCLSMAPATSCDIVEAG